jgi:hypothetical protein
VRASEALTALLVSQEKTHDIVTLAEALGGLRPLPAQAMAAKAAVIAALGRRDDPYRGEFLAEALLGLRPTDAEKAEARRQLLPLIRGSSKFAGAACALARLEPTDEETSIALHELHDRFDAQPWRAHRSARISWYEAEAIAQAMSALAVTCAHRGEALRLLIDQPSRLLAYDTDKVLETAASLAATEPDRAELKAAIIALLQERSHFDAPKLFDVLVTLSPTVGDLAEWQHWASGPTSKILATARQNSPVEDWITALPSLPAVSVSA